VLDIVDGAGAARALIHPGVGAQFRSTHRISLRPGSRTVPLCHPSDAVYFVMAGTGVVRPDDSAPEQPLRSGLMIHIDGGTGYLFAAGDAGLELVGGPCPPDPALYEAIGG
jgi:mannose-6-phosphate isomerase-like protein (cupin superfamily)